MGVGSGVGVGTGAAGGGFVCRRPDCARTDDAHSARISRAKVVTKRLGFMGVGNSSTDPQDQKTDLLHC